MSKNRWIYLALVTAALAHPALAVPTDSSGLEIAAVVGDDAISSYDVDARIKFILATTQLSHTPDVIAHIRPQVVRSLVDEKLQLREAKKNDIKITDADISKAIATIEQERGMPPGAIFQQLDKSDVPRQTFLDQVHAQLAWRKVIGKNIRSHVHVDDQEIELAKNKMIIPTTYTEVKIGVITLPVDKASHENEIHTLGDKLVKEVKGGADFEEVGRQFGSAGAKVTAFWVRPEQLDPLVAKALSGAKIGDIVNPVRTEVGYTIVKLYDAKSVSEEPEQEQEVKLKEILLKLKPDASTKEADTLLSIGEDVAKNPGTCQEKGVANITNLQDFDIDVNYQTMRESQLPPAIKIIADNLKVGDISTPFASNEGIRLYMLCDRKDAPPPQLDRSKVENFVFQQKMELEAQKYMRNLRRETYIDIRGSDHS